MFQVKQSGSVAVNLTSAQVSENNPAQRTDFQQELAELREKERKNKSGVYSLLTQDDERIDREISSAQALLDRYKKDGHFTKQEREELAKRFQQIQHDEEKFEKSKDSLVKGVEIAAAVGAGIGITVASGGLGAGAGAALVASAVGSAAVSVGAHRLVQGETYSSDDMQRDLAVGTVAGLVGGAGAGKAVAGAITNKLVSVAAAGAIDGVASGSAGSVTGQSLHADTWTHGAGHAAESLGGAALSGGVVGGLTGAAIAPAAHYGGEALAAKLGAHGETVESHAAQSVEDARHSNHTEPANSTARSTGEPPSSHENHASGQERTNPRKMLTAEDILQTEDPAKIQNYAVELLANREYAQVRDFVSRAERQGALSSGSGEGIYNRHCLELLRFQPERYLEAVQSLGIRPQEVEAELMEAMRAKASHCVNHLDAYSAIAKRFNVDLTSGNRWKLIADQSAVYLASGGDVSVVEHALEGIGKPRESLSPILYRALRIKVIDACEPRLGHQDFEAVVDFARKYDLERLDPKELTNIANQLRGYGSPLGRRLADLLPASERSGVLYAGGQAPTAEMLRSVRTLSGEQDCLVIHALPTDERFINNTQENNSLVSHSAASLEGRVAGSFAAHELSCSTIRPGDGLRGTTYPTGLIITEGRVASAYATDAFVMVEPQTGLRFSKDTDALLGEGRIQRDSHVGQTTGLAVNFRQAEFGATIPTLRQCERTAPGHNELLVRSPKISGIFLGTVENLSELSDVRSRYYAPSLRNLGLPMYAETPSGLVEVRVENNKWTYRPTTLRGIIDRQVNVSEDALRGLLNSTRNFWAKGEALLNGTASDG